MSRPPRETEPAAGTIRAMEGPAALALLDDSWDAALAGGDPPGSPSQTGAWLRGVGRRLPEGVAPLVVRVDDPEGGMLAGLALNVQPVRVGPFRLRVATWLGHRTRRVFSPRVVGTGGAGAPGRAAIAHALSRVDGLVLHNTPADAGVWEALRAVAPWAGRRPAPPSWTVGLPDAATARRARAVDYEIRRARRAGADVRVDVVDAPGAVATATDRMILMHAGRWSERPDQSGFSATEDDREFHRRIFREMAADPGLELGIAVVSEGDVPVGATAFLRANGVAMLYRTAMAGDAVLRGPGVTATVSSLRHLESLGLRVVDLGIGEASFKERLGGRPAAAAHLFAASSRRWQRPLELVLRVRERRR